MKPKYRRMLRGMKVKEEHASYLSATAAKRGAKAVSKAKSKVAPSPQSTSAPARAPAPAPAPAPPWSLYILKCRDESLYTGISNDIDRRFLAHQEGKASRYTRTRRPVALVSREECGSRSQALTRECAVKSLSRRKKEEMIEGKKREKEGS